MARRRGHAGVHTVSAIGTGPDPAGEAGFPLPGRKLFPCGKARPHISAMARRTGGGPWDAEPEPIFRRSRARCRGRLGHAVGGQERGRGAAARATRKSAIGHGSRQPRRIRSETSRRIRRRGPRMRGERSLTPERELVLATARRNTPNISLRRLLYVVSFGFRTYLRSPGP